MIWAIDPSFHHHTPGEDLPPGRRPSGNVPIDPPGGLVAQFGIRHVHLLVADQATSVAFYQEAFGMRERFRDGPIVFLTTPDGGDSLALHHARTDDERARVGQRGGWEHFGIHLPDRSATGIDDAIARVRAAGGQLTKRGEHAPGVHYAYVTDPDGYPIEI